MAVSGRPGAGGAAEPPVQCEVGLAGARACVAGWVWKASGGGVGNKVRATQSAGKAKARGLPGAAERGAPGDAFSLEIGGQGAGNPSATISVGDPQPLTASSGAAALDASDAAKGSPSKSSIVCRVSQPFRNWEAPQFTSFSIRGRGRRPYHRGRRSGFEECAASVRGSVAVLDRCSFRCQMPNPEEYACCGFHSGKRGRKWGGLGGAVKWPAEATW